LIQNAQKLRTGFSVHLTEAKSAPKLKKHLLDLLSRHTWREGPFSRDLGGVPPLE
jgi:hypothetical protein